MAFPAVLISFSVVMVAAVQARLPQVADSSHSYFSRFGPSVVPSQVGICATSVIPHGYKCQEIEVKTEDGYILSMQRIPFGRASVRGGQQNKQPVLIQHGVLVGLRNPWDGLYLTTVSKQPCLVGISLLLSALYFKSSCISPLTIQHLVNDWDGTTWFLNQPDKNLPMILADNGFDVWIANTRGTRYSRRHVNLDPDYPAYWNWSWDELVAYDLPAAFDFVYGQTGQKIHYVGHSLGTLIALASFSEGRLVDQLKSAALLSPIAYLSHMTTALGAIAARVFIGEMTTIIGVAEFNPKGKAVSNFLKSLCHLPGIDCYDLLTAITGKNCCLNSSTLDLFLQNEPQSTSTKNMVHLAQTVRTGVLAKFNYGRSDYNLQHYGDASPPIYNLSNIPHDLPLFLSYGGKDALSDIVDVGTLLDCLKFHDGDKLQVQFIKDYGHADFIMGLTAKDLVYLPVVKFFNRR